MSKYDPAYYQKNKKKMLKDAKLWFRKNRTKVLEYHKKYRNTHKHKRHIDRINRYKGIKEKLFNILGGKNCTCKSKDCWHKGNCKIKDDRCLQFDHKNGDGIKDPLTQKGRTVLYKYAIDHPKFARKRLQVLCANCNWIKRHRNNENPYNKIIYKIGR